MSEGSKEECGSPFLVSPGAGGGGATAMWFADVRTAWSRLSGLDNQGRGLPDKGRGLSDKRRGLSDKGRGLASFDSRGRQSYCDPQSTKPYVE